MKKNNSGITLMILVVTIIVLIIIASITVYEGKELISKSKVQTLETNMLTIQAKAKAYAEEIDAKIWTKSGSASDVDENGNTPKDIARNSEFIAEKIGFTGPINITNSDILEQVSQEITNNYVAYEVTGNALINMGLKDIKDEKYVVIYSKDNYKLMDVIYSNGVKYKTSELHFTLSNLQSVLSD